MKAAMPILGALLCLSAPALRADFSYEQTSELTGGTMASVMKMAGAFSSGAGQTTRTRVVIKGDRMAQIDEETTIVTDLAAQTITTINQKRKEYNVVTFEQMRQYMENMAARARGQQNQDQSVDAEVSISVDRPGERKVVNGFDAELVNMSMKVEGRNPQTGQQAAMDMLMMSWFSDSLPGYDEVREFYKRYAESVSWASGGAMSMFTQGNQGAVEGISELYKEMSEVDGMPVQQVMRMGSGDLAAIPPAEEREEASGDSGASMGEALAKGLGGFGGFGGFGRNRNQQQEQEETAAPSADSGMLMEMTINMSGFSNSEVDPALVDTEPAGFKRVQSEIEKSLK